MQAMGLGRPSDAPVVTGRVGRWHLTLLEIPSAGADPVTSVHKNSLRAAGRGACAIRALPDLCVGIVSERLEDSGPSRFLLWSPNSKPRRARGFLFERSMSRPCHSAPFFMSRMLHVFPSVFNGCQSLPAAARLRAPDGP